MPNLLDLAYGVAAVAASPVWVPSMARRGLLRTDWSARFGHGEPLGDKRAPRVLLHAVSVGEVNATDLLVDELMSGPDPVEPIVAAMTDNVW